MTEFQPSQAPHGDGQAARQDPFAQPTQPQVPPPPADPTFLVAHDPGVVPAQAAFNAPTQPASAQAGYGQAGYAPPAYPAPTAFQAPTWTPLAASRPKRKVWPWVVGGIATLIILGATGIGVVLFIAQKTIDGANPDYSAAKIASDDEPAAGNTMVLGESGKVALEVPQEWVSVTDDLKPYMQDVDVPGFTTQEFEAWLAGDPNDASTTSIVMFLDSGGPLVVSGSVEGFHKGFVSSFNKTFDNPTVVDDPAFTSATGLETYHSHCEALIDGAPTSFEVYTSGRGTHFVSLVVVDYSGGGADFRDVPNSVRIDK